MYDAIAQIARSEFDDIVTDISHIGRRADVTLKVRLGIRDGTFIDVWWSVDGTRYSYHWEQRAQRGRIHRHDNAPDHPEIPTHPKHFHDGSEGIIVESHIPETPADATRYFLRFVRNELARLEINQGQAP